jgi:predicted nucleotidyltransferase
MIPTHTIDEFVKRIRAAAGANVESIILFGSAVSGDFHPDLSNLNMLCVLRDSSFESLRALTGVAKWWDRQKQPPPLCMTRHELERSTDVFPIELLDMQNHHRVLFGDDVLGGLQIPMNLHRVQVEYELREKLILLRQHIMVASENESRLVELLQRSVSSFSTLFRHALITFGEAAPNGKREAVKSLERRLNLDFSAINEVLDLRERKNDIKAVNVSDLVSRYLKAVEEVAAAVDAT